ncbi:OmpA family protein [Flammeovirga yaeyamensis]|uniref:OmpA family protein n=1 Tax=Flammeovirga yaeyamensis TaxID=367791 RepID=A0AAX1N2N6_9BACT|nr:OmpA family protein [Flammeovirga yaeyamensis]MBB3701227.1 outer membrane protein OmpA-like peptidoglycan-associated protein [Flammeovirga yaeyamensis]NMF38447.1 OmpA family protein [Flammeovirga yaeyamensis]QWG01692.1 OmpA family protein [Flammeovirga yaeyamensis]
MKLHLHPLFTVCVILFSINLSFGQKVKHTSEFKKAVRYAKEYMKYEEFHHAEEVLKHVADEGASDTEWNYLMGYVYIHSQTLNKSHALAYFEKVNDEETYPELKRLKAVSLQYNHRFKEAYDLYDHYLSTTKTDKKLTKELELLKKQCLKSMELMDDSLEMIIVNLGPNINSEYQDFAPVLSADEKTLIFTSRRPDSKGGDIDPIDGLYYEDVYIAHHDEEGVWQKAKNIGTTVNTKGHDAAVGISPSGNSLFLYRNTGSHSGDLYLSQWNGKDWSRPLELSKDINSDNWETHASLTADGKSLYFTSNRSQKDAHGGKDIYVIHKEEDGSWGKAENLGPVINTEYDEESPFIHPSGKVLYFSSKGHNGMGGYDIYSSEWNESTKAWSTPKNIGYPINTAGDDVFYSISSDGQRGYFSSIREDSYGGQDIYMAIVPSETVQSIALVGEVRDATSNNLVEAGLSVVENDVKEEIITASAEGGKYLFYLEPDHNYGFRVLQSGYLFHSKNINIKEIDQYLEINDIVKLKRIAPQEREELNNIFFDDQLNITEQSEAELNDLANFIKNVEEYKIGIHVHEALSDKDSASVMEYTQDKADKIAKELISRGVDVDKLEVEGFGWQHPIASNNSKLGRLKNQRIEYVILPKDIEEVAFVEVVVEDTIPVLEPTLGEVLDVIGTINFAFNSNVITSESFRVIEQVFDVMDRYPDLLLEVGGHTDNKGTAAFNTILGEKRSKAVVQQLIIMGIEKSRLTHKSYGFKQPIADNNTEEGRKKNRRISFTPLEFRN